MYPHLPVKPWPSGCSKFRKLDNFITYLYQGLKIMHNNAQTSGLRISVQAAAATLGLYHTTKKVTVLQGEASRTWRKKLEVELRNTEVG